MTKDNAPNKELPPPGREKLVWKWHKGATETVEIYLRPEEKERLEREATAELMPLHEYIVYTMLLTEEEKRVRTLQDIQEGLESAARGEGRPAEEVFAELRRKYDISE